MIVVENISLKAIIFERNRKQRILAFFMNEIRRFSLMIKRLRTRFSPLRRDLQIGQLARNAERTANEHAAAGNSWKEYWQVFTQRDFPTTCPFCGQPLAEEDIDGCHIEIADRLVGGWSTKKFIIPGHHDCNMQLGEEFTSKLSLPAVEAIER